MKNFLAVLLAFVLGLTAGFAFAPEIKKMLSKKTYDDDAMGFDDNFFTDDTIDEE